MTSHLDVGVCLPEAASYSAPEPLRHYRVSKMQPHQGDSTGSRLEIESLSAPASGSSLTNNENKGIPPHSPSPRTVKYCSHYV